MRQTHTCVAWRVADLFSRGAHRIVGVSFLATLASVTSIAGCGVQRDESESGADALSEPGVGELPWEVRSRSGETLLPNVFYAEASENEQIMPLTIRGR